MSTGLWILALALQVLPSPGSVRWEPLVREGEQSIEIDPASVVRDGELAMYTVRINAGPRAEGGPSVMVLRHAMNCRTGRIGIMAGDGYDADGRLIGSRTTPPAEVVYQDYPVDDNARRMRRRVCGTANS